MSQKVPETLSSLQKLPEAPKYFADSDRFPIDSDSILEDDSDPNAYYYDAGSEAFKGCLSNWLSPNMPSLGFSTWLLQCSVLCWDNLA